MQLSNNSLNLENLIRTAGDAVVVSDVDGNIILWNPAAERMFGYSAEEALGESLDLIIPEKQRGPHWAGYDQVMQTGETKYGADTLRVPASHKEGKTLSIAFTVSLMIAEDGQVEAIAAIIRDETERWQKERALRKELAELKQAQAS